MMVSLINKMSTEGTYMCKGRGGGVMKEGPSLASYDPVSTVFM